MQNISKILSYSFNIWMLTAIVTKTMYACGKVNMNVSKKWLLATNWEINVCISITNWDTKQQSITKLYKNSNSVGKFTLVRERIVTAERSFAFFNNFQTLNFTRKSEMRSHTFVKHTYKTIFIGHHTLSNDVRLNRSQLG